MNQAMSSSLSTTLATAVYVSIAAAAAASAVIAGISIGRRETRSERKTSRFERYSSSSVQAVSCVSTAHEDLIGNTPLIKLHTLSALLGRNNRGYEIWVKMENLNPSGTGKDRAALGMIRSAEQAGQLPPPRSIKTLVERNDANNQQLEQNNNQQSMANSTESTVTTEPNSSSSYKSSPKTIVSDSAMDATIELALQRSRSGGLVVEGTSGSTGIALAMLCQSRGHACVVVLPDDQAFEKQQVLKTLGAQVWVVPTAAISHPHHYVNLARKLAQRAKETHHIRAVFLDQFENPANFNMHYTTTGPELLQQCPNMSAFVMSCGTGGTLAGVSRYLKEECKLRRQQQHQSQHENENDYEIRTVLVDPPGSALYNKIQHGVVFAPQQRERSLKRHRYDTIAEGIGLDRWTHNLELASTTTTIDTITETAADDMGGNVNTDETSLSSSSSSTIDTAIQVTDQEALDMAHWLLRHEGLWVGSSSAMNVVGAVRTALDLPAPASDDDSPRKIVTVICDGGHRHLTRFWNQEFCEQWGLLWPGLSPTTKEERIPECLQIV